MHFSTALSEAASKLDGGARSFPVDADDDMAKQYPYQPPTTPYDRFFSSRLHKPLPNAVQELPLHSAGWLIPGPHEGSYCKPVFIAHSNLSAIWLLRETLGYAALSDEGWASLVRAARACTRDPYDSTDETDIITTTPSSPSETPRRQSPVDSDDENAGAPPHVQVPNSEPVASPKRANSARHTTPSKRARVHRDQTPFPVLDETLLASPSLPSHDNPVIHTTTVTKNNRRADQQRITKPDASRAKKRITLGQQEPDSKAPMQERAAYSAIPPEDEPTIAWIIKQSISDEVDFYTGSPTPYFTACTMIQKARALGNQSSRRYAAQFLQRWREYGTPFQAGMEGMRLLQHPQLQQTAASNASQRGSTDDVFCFAWSMCGRYDTAFAAVHIGARWALALLGHSYTQKMEQIREGDFVASNDRTRNRYGKGQVRTEAIAALKALVNLPATKKDNDLFRYRLTLAIRWHKIVQVLGWGGLLLIPHEEVSNRWLERVLLIGQLDVFLALVQRERPELCAAGKVLETWLGPDGISGAPISGKQKLSIETGALATVYEIEEIPDSEDEDEDTRIFRSPMSVNGTASPAPPPQMTLLELFHPAAL
jgi:hypothetical protein